MPGKLLRTAAQLGHLVINTEENRKPMLSITKFKVEGMKLTVLVDTGASASFLQIDWSKQNIIEIYISNDAY